MYQSSEKLLHAAEVLEKVAQYFDREEQEEQLRKTAAVKNNFLDPISSAVELQPTLTEKLANTDPEVLAFIKDMTTEGQTKVAQDYSMGSATERHDASAHQDPLLAFCLGDN